MWFLVVAAAIIGQLQVFADRVEMVCQFFHAVCAQEHGHVIKLDPTPLDVCRFVAHGGTLTHGALARFRPQQGYVTANLQVLKDAGRELPAILMLSPEASPLSYLIVA
jgi:hypothetical protein